MPLDNVPHDNRVLEIVDVSRFFSKNTFRAVDGLSLTIDRGEIVGLLGPNGAGKTTTVKMASTLLLPTRGAIRVCGVDAISQPRAARAHLGLMLGGDLGFYPRASARDNLLFFADIARIDGSRRKQRVNEALERVQLSDAADKRVNQFSRGMTQRLHLARALLGDPQLLLLDEPTSGLDPDIALHVRLLVRDLATTGVGILLTSHSMSEVEELADRIDVIGAGRIRARGRVHDIATAAGIALITTATLPANAHDHVDALRRAVGDAGSVTTRAYRSQWALSIAWNRSDIDAATVDRIFATAGVAQPVDTMTRQPTLEETYLALAEGLAR